MITVEEALKSKGISIGPMLKDSVREADYSIPLGEKVVEAWSAAFSVDGSFHAGIIAITTHQLLCCSCIANNLIFAKIPFSECIGIGDEKGIIQKQMPVHCDDVCITIKASGEHISQIRSALLKGIEEAPLQKPFDLKPAVIKQDSVSRNNVQKIKKAHIGERRLSKSESAAYGSCPNCRGKILVEKSGAIYCLNCGHKFKPGK